MTKNPIIQLLVVPLLPLLVVSCAKTEVENAYSRQDSNIESIVKSLTDNNKEATVDYFDGVVRVTVAPGEGEALQSDGTVSFYYAGHCISGSSLSSNNLFVTNSKEFAESNNWTVTDSTIFEVSTVNLAKDALVKGLKKGIVGVRPGDECYVLFNGKYGFGKHTTGNVPGNSALAYHLWITGVTN